MMKLLETPSRIEPCLIDVPTPELIDLVAELSRAATVLGERLHPRSAASLADLVRVMNCYYSNLIEGHNTKPREIEAALVDRFADDDDRRNLQLEAKAHIHLQREIDRRYASGTLPDPASVDFICSLHRSFYDNATDAMLVLRSSDRVIRIRPGHFRESPEEEVSVGRHLPPSSRCIAAFMDYFADKYRMEDARGFGSRILAIPAAHHRLNYIHPFIDGNGRVSRLVSHAMAYKAGIGAHGLWSISRGLARGLQSRAEYKNRMDSADTPRQGDLDGRGNLSRRALVDFTIWFLKVCLDQIAFMSSLFQLGNLNKRLRIYVARHNFRDEAWFLLEQVLLRGEVPRGDAVRLTGLKERTARTLLADLVAHGILDSDTPKSPVSLRFPMDAAEILFPDLVPDMGDDHDLMYP